MGISLLQKLGQRIYSQIYFLILCFYPSFEKFFKVGLLSFISIYGSFFFDCQFLLHLFLDNTFLKEILLRESFLWQIFR